MAKTRGFSAQALGDTDILLLTGPKPYVLQTLDFIDRLDTQESLPVLEVLELKHRPASEVLALTEAAISSSRLLADLSLQGEAIALPDDSGIILMASPPAKTYWQSIIDRLDSPTNLITEMYRPEQQDLGELLEVVKHLIEDAEPSGSNRSATVQQAGGTIFVRASPSAHQRIRAYLASSEAHLDEEGGQLRVIPLRYRVADEVANSIEELIGFGGYQVQDDEEPTGSSVMDSAAVADPTPWNGRIGALSVDADSNSLIGFLSNREYADLLGILEVLDTPQYQVFIEVITLTLTETDSQNFGIELQSLYTAGDDSLVQLSSVFGFGGPQVDGPLPSSQGQGITATVLNPGEFSAIVRALQAVGSGRSVAMPRVLVQNNGTADLNSVLEQPFLSTNASDTVATTSLGGATAAGTTIQVTPTIIANDRLTLDYRISVSSFVGDSADPSLPPPRQENSLNSTASIPDGYAIVVGGIALESESRGISKVPLLGNMPVIGGLFRSQTTSKDSTKFYTLIRASIDRSSSYEALRARSRSVASTLGLPQGIPELLPMVMD